MRESFEIRFDRLLLKMISYAEFPFRRASSYNRRASIQSSASSHIRRPSRQIKMTSSSDCCFVRQIPEPGQRSWEINLRMKQSSVGELKLSI